METGTGDFEKKGTRRGYDALKKEMSSDETVTS